MTKAAEIFKEDGTLRGLNLVNPSGNRGAALALRLVDGDKKVATTYTTGDDFLAAYSRAVATAAVFYGVGSRTKLYKQLEDSVKDFLAANNLKLEPTHACRAVPK